jgi:hypothetical protein
VREANTARADVYATFLADDGNGEPGEIPERASTREITEWSRKSRANMWHVFHDLDYAPMFTDPTRLPAMVTVTYPGDWLTVAPNGAAAKKHLDKLRKRYERAFDEPLRCIWKEEFQDRGAPHFHLMMCPPHHVSSDGRPFLRWLKAEWADVVAHPDPEERRKHAAAGVRVDFNDGIRSCDPRRVAVYFAKHGSFSAKEYQHCVPEAWQAPGQGPGRFWGYWGLKRKVAARQVDPEMGTIAGRLLRGWSKAQRVSREVTRPRVAGGRAVNCYPEVIGLAGAYFLAAHSKAQYRKTRVRAVRCRNGRGWVAVNDGPKFATELAFALNQTRVDRHRSADEAELRRAGWWDTPAARAQRLRPGARRDALLAKLAARTQ